MKLPTGEYFELELTSLPVQYALKNMLSCFSSSLFLQIFKWIFFPIWLIVFPLILFAAFDMLYYSYPAEFYFKFAQLHEWCRTEQDRLFIDGGWQHEVRQEKINQRKVGEWFVDFIKRVMGDGTSTNKAFRLYLFAARLSYLPAMTRVSEMYRLGIGTAKNVSKAESWFKKGLSELKRLAETGDKEKAKILSNYYRSKGETELADYWDARSI